MDFLLKEPIGIKKLFDYTLQLITLFFYINNMNQINQSTLHSEKTINIVKSGALHFSHVRLLQ